MKTLLRALFFGNVIFFAVMQWGGLLDEQAAKAQPALHEEKIILLSAPLDKQPDVLPAPDASASAAAHAPVAVKPVCMEWGDFSGARLAQASAALATLQLGDKLSRQQIEYPVSYWVYIPPMKNKAVVNKKIAQLKALGIDEYFVVSEPGHWLNAISLGVFMTQETAQRFLDDLQHTKGMHGAQAGERPGKFKVTRFVLNGLDVDASASLAEIQKDFAGSELRDVPCALTS